jgi:hypothetical protein
MARTLFSMLSATVMMVLSAPNEASSQKATKPNTPEPAHAGIGDRALTFGGRTFDDWRKLVSTDLDPETRAKAYSALGAFASHGKAAEAVSAISQALPREQMRVAVEAAYGALVSAGDQGTTILVQGIRHQDGLHRHVALEVLGRGYSKKMSGTAPAVMEALQKGDTESRRLACRALEHIVVAEDVAFALEGTPKEDRTVAPIRVPQEPSATVASVALALGQSLKDADASVRIAAATSLEHIGPKAKAAVPSLIEYTRAAFVRIKTGEHAAVERLKTRRSQRTSFPLSNFQELTQGLAAIGSMGPAASAAVPLLTEIKSDERFHNLSDPLENVLDAIQAKQNTP